MAALPKPSVRASRRVAGLHPPTEPAATDKGQNISKSPPTRNVKRTRISLESENGRRGKKPRLGMPIPPVASGQRKPAKVPSKTAEKKANAVARPESRAQPPINGTHKAPRSPRPGARRSDKAPFKSHVTSIAVANESSQANEGKRTLRSQGGASRFKSDLALFFPCYDEMISNEPKTPGRSSACAGCYCC